MSCTTVSGMFTGTSHHFEGIYLFLCVPNFLFNNYVTLATMCLSPAIKTDEVMHSDQIGVTVILAVM